MIDGKMTIELDGKFGQWNRSSRPAVFQNRTFNWFRSQLLFYLTRYNARTLQFVQNTIAKNFLPPSLNLHRPFVAIYVRRSDKVKSKEMSQAYTLKDYFDLFAGDAGTANITTVYLNSEDAQVFDEYALLNATGERYRHLLHIPTSRNVVFRTLIAMSRRKRGAIVLEFLTDLFIEVHADLHAGTLSSNWCRLVDEIRLTIGKTLPFYTPENTYFIEAKWRNNPLHESWIKIVDKIDEDKVYFPDSLFQNSSENENHSMPLVLGLPARSNDEDYRDHIPIISIQMKVSRWKIWSSLSYQHTLFWISLGLTMILFLIIIFWFQLTCVLYRSILMQRQFQWECSSSRIASFLPGQDMCSRRHHKIASSVHANANGLLIDIRVSH